MDDTKLQKEENFAQFGWSFIAINASIGTFWTGARYFLDSIYFRNNNAARLAFYDKYHFINLLILSGIVFSGIMLYSVGVRLRYGKTKLILLIISTHLLFWLISTK